MKRFLVCIPQHWEDVNRQVAIPYSVMAESPKRAVMEVLKEHPRIREYVNGEITVVEAKAGRLDNWHNFYKIEQFPAED